MIEVIYTIGFIVTTIIAVFVMLFTADDLPDFIGLSFSSIVKTKTFPCQCGHLAYWVKYRGWHCYCNNPRK